ncbi:MAG TPA: AAA family ATPase [Nitrospirae bacterium]|nr:transcriptional regulatory protein ZraR [bacterium BMS3Abin06]HDH11120.1 AAA family ATPase [Nitrospirota bacterium]HDZ02521.1 AAA family ATPase [Nitrospirota bacterium]
MSRLDVRCKVDLPVFVIADNKGGKGVTETEAKITSLSLSGAFIDYERPSAEKAVVGLKYDLPKHGEFEILGEVTRLENDGFAARFYNLNRDAKLKLWDYIKENIVDDLSCPYCGKENTQKFRKCDRCGWGLNFYSQGYIVEHEKESFLNRLDLKSKSFSIEDIYKILNFIDVEILKIGKNLDINEEFVGSSRGVLDVFSMIRKVAPTEIPVLITGESGTGKELTAMAIHERSQRRNKPFVTINCAAIPDNLLESELFGHEKGAFTGAHASKIGKFEYADGGTIFLDEIGELSPNLQSKLLRFLEDRIVEKIGSNNGRKVDARLIAATNRDIKSVIANGSFRKDLFYRLDVFNIHLPPVRDRGEDKVILARYFLNKFSRELNVNKTFSSEAIGVIKSYEWPGNVREIINRIRRAVVMSGESSVTPQDLGLDVPVVQVDTVKSLKEVRYSIEKQKLIEALRHCNNNISKVARVLGISRPSVYSLRKRYNI